MRSAWSKLATAERNWGELEVEGKYQKVSFRGRQDAVKMICVEDRKGKEVDQHRNKVHT